MKLRLYIISKARQTRLPACPGQVKLTGGQANVKLTFPFGQAVIFTMKIYKVSVCCIYKYFIII